MASEYTLRPMGLQLARFRYRNALDCNMLACEYRTPNAGLLLGNAWVHSDTRTPNRSLWGEYLLCRNSDEQWNDDHPRLRHRSTRSRSRYDEPRRSASCPSVDWTCPLGPHPRLSVLHACVPSRKRAQH